MSSELTSYFLSRIIKVLCPFFTRDLGIGLRPLSSTLYTVEGDAGGSPLTGEPLRGKRTQETPNRGLGTFIENRRDPECRLQERGRVRFKEREIEPKNKKGKGFFTEGAGVAET